MRRAFALSQIHLQSMKFGNSGQRSSINKEITYSVGAFQLPLWFNHPFLAFVGYLDKAAIIMSMYENAFIRLIDKR